MAEERIRLEIGQPVHHNDHLPGNQGVTLQHAELLARTAELGESGSVVVAEADAYLDPDQYWATYWFTHTSPGALIELTEKTLDKFEQQFLHGVATVDKKIRMVSTPKVVELLWRAAAIAQFDIDIRPRHEYRSGVILFTSEKPDGSGRRLTFPLQRPLSWERLDRLSHQKPISFARLNTPVGDFCVTRKGDNNTFSFITDLARIEPFAPLLELTAEEGVSHEKAMEFLGTVVGLFETR